MDFAVSVLFRDVGFEQLIGCWRRTGIPCCMDLIKNGPSHAVCSQNAKGFGRDAQIEGDIKDGQRVLLVEDLTTDGGSKIKFCEALRRAGAEVQHTIVIFYYDIFPETKATMKKHDLTLHYLASVGCIKGVQGDKRLR